MVCLLQNYYFTFHEIVIGKSGKTVNLAYEASTGRIWPRLEGPGRNRTLVFLPALYSPHTKLESRFTGHNDLRNRKFPRLKMSCSLSSYLSSRSFSNSVCFLPSSVCSTSMLSCNSLFADSSLSNWSDILSRSTWALDSASRNGLS